MQHNLNSFSLDSKFDSYYDYEGEDYSNKYGDLSFINLIPNRTERKRAAANYNLNNYAETTKEINDRDYKPGPGPKPKGVLGIGINIHDFQFYDQKRLLELKEREDMLLDQRRNQLLLIKEVKGNELKIRKRISWRRNKQEAKDAAARAAGETQESKVEEVVGSDDDDRENDGGEDGIEDGEERVDNAIPAEAEVTTNAVQSSKQRGRATHQSIETLEAESEALRHHVEELEAGLAKFELSAEEKAERQRILDQAFGNWTKIDFRKFIAACERHGRGNLEAICADMEPHGKSREDTAKYFKVSFTNY